VRIQAVERFIGDYALGHGILPNLPEKNRQAVAVVGAGPAGLSAAYFLRMQGHPVTIYEKSDRIGGALWKEIPPFRLPRMVLEKELERFENIGIRLELYQALGRNVSVLELRRKYAAVVLAIGRSRSRELGVVGEDCQAVFDGARLLETLHREQPVEIGKRILVVGGTSTAMDCARTLLRMGHAIKVIYRRSRKEALASKTEIEETLEEGIGIAFQTEPIRLVFQNDQLVGVVSVRTEPGKVDIAGRRQALPIRDSEFVIPADAVVTAKGKVLNVDELSDSVDTNRGIEVDSQYRTSAPGVYACGDCISSSGVGGDAVGDAIRMGREVASEIHAGLEEGSYLQPDPLKRRGASSEISKIKDFNRAYYANVKSVPLPVRPPADRIKDFAESVQTLKESDIRAEAARCIKCGTCIGCDNCVLFCPDASIVKRDDGTGYDILYDYCKGCGVCVEECPRGAIHLRRVDRSSADAGLEGILS
jgi:2-oxoacid:acceptor oxidoreductase delta subunit (pyruvate/2-ketoisovalerate family)